MTLLAILVLGLVLGVRHATDADHVVAVSTIVSRERSARAAVLIGMLWGLGHTVTILVVGGALVLFGLVVPPRVGLSMEMCVAVMLVVLGAINLRAAFCQIDKVAAASVEGEPRVQLGRGLVRPLVVGVVHGLAGSAAVALLVLTTIKEASTALLYLALFGLGTVLGMMSLTLAMAVPMRLASGRFPNSERWMAQLTGTASVLLGLFLVYQIGFVDGLIVGVPNWSPK